MIFCTTKPPEEYMVTLPSGGVYGLWDTYGHDPELFNLISRVSPAMFMYEPGFDIPPGAVIVTLDKDVEDKIVDTLDKRVLGLTVREILHYYSPEDMLELFSKEDVSHLPINDPVLNTIMIMRVSQHRHHYRGLLDSDDKVSKVKFKSDLTAEEAEWLGNSIRTIGGK